MKIFSIQSIFIAISLLCSYSMQSQDETDTPFGKGLMNQTASDSTWKVKMSFRFQTQYEGIELDELNEKSIYSDRFRVRRARIKGSGWATKGQRLKYKFEYDVHNGFVLDAVIKWVFDKNKNWELWFGQTKLPGNMERVISSQKLQFVDRSLLNSRFTLDRDAGIQVHGKQKLSEDFIVKEKLSLAQGEGLNQTGQSQGYGLTARLELFPFGTFKDAYVSSSMKRHDQIKLMVGATFDLNQDALRTRGQKGSYLDDALPRKDLQTIFLDAHLKYKSVSWMTEFAQRSVTEGSPLVSAMMIDGGGLITELSESYYTGQSINTSIGYLMSSNWELAVRYTMVDAENETGNPDMTQYGFAVSKYIVGHNLKVQSDINLLETEGSGDQLMFRLQTEFNF